MRLRDSRAIRAIARSIVLLGDDIRPIVQRPIVRDFIGAGPFNRALDAGCGRGLYTGLLVERCVEVDAIDLSSHHIAAQSRRKGKKGNLRLAVGSVDALPYPDNSFDLTVHCEVLEHIADDVGALSELWRTLKPEGRLVISVPVPPAPIVDSEHVREGYRYDEIENLLVSQGFKVLRKQFCMFALSKALMRLQVALGIHIPIRIPLPSALLLPLYLERILPSSPLLGTPYDVVIEALKPSC